MTFTDTYPAPDTENATARQIAGYYAAEALWLLGRAERRRSLYGPADNTHLHLLSLSAAQTHTAYALHCHDAGVPAGSAARALLGVEEEAVQECAYLIAGRGGYDPSKARREGYESS